MCSILVVDDDKPTRDTLRFVLEDAGYSVVDASDGQSALAKLVGAPKPMVTLLDLLMPGMSGVEMLRVVVADPTLTRHRYIGMSAAVGPVMPEAEELLNQLNGAMLLKPFDMDPLLDAIRGACASLSAGIDGPGSADGRAPSRP